MAGDTRISRPARREGHAYRQASAAGGTRASAGQRGGKMHARSITQTQVWHGTRNPRRATQASPANISKSKGGSDTSTHPARYTREHIAKTTRQGAKTTHDGASPTQPLGAVTKTVAPKARNLQRHASKNTRQAQTLAGRHESTGADRKTRPRARDPQSTGADRKTRPRP